LKLVSLKKKEEEKKRVEKKKGGETEKKNLFLYLKILYCSASKP
jgi:hypothetical protein